MLRRSKRKAKRGVEMATETKTAGRTGGKAPALYLGAKPRTGHVVMRLSDPSLKPDISKLKEKLRTDPKFALETLQSAGIATSTGKLTKRFKG